MKFKHKSKKQKTPHHDEVVSQALVLDEVEGALRLAALEERGGGGPGGGNGHRGDGPARGAGTPADRKADAAAGWGGEGGDGGCGREGGGGGGGGRHGNESGWGSARGSGLRGGGAERRR